MNTWLVTYEFRGVEHSLSVVAETEKEAISVANISHNPTSKAVKTETSLVAAKERKSSKQIQTEEYEHLREQGYPRFEVTPEHENTPFIKERDSQAYDLFFTYAKSKIEEELSLDEKEPTLVFGRVGFDIWSDQKSLQTAIGALTSLGIENASRYIKVGGSSHGIKFNLCLPNHPALLGLDLRLQTNFPHPRLAASGLPDLRTVQIGKRSICEQLIRDGILPEENE